MAEYITGQNGNFYWIEFPGNSLNLNGFLSKHSSILVNKYLAIVCYDGGPLKLMIEEKDQGWYEKDKITYSPILTRDLIAALPHDQYDQWCLFNAPTEFTGMTGFVNYGNFKIANRRQELIDADETWDKLGLEKNIEDYERLVEQFWKEMIRINPVNFILDGDNFIFVSRNVNEIEMIKKSWP